MCKSLKRALVAGAITAAFGAGSALPASAHILVVDSPGGGGPDAVWVGGPAGLKAEGKGLVAGGPTGVMMPPSHVKSLVTACITIRDQGKAAVDIFGPNAPGAPTTCKHGGQPDGRD